MRRSPAGHSQRDFCTVLEYYGYTLVRHVRHGAMYRHPELAAHSDVEVRRSLARVVVPKGDELKDYVAEEVIASVDFLLSTRNESKDG